MHIPTLEQAQAMLDDAAQRNPGPWIDHSVYVAQAAQYLAEKIAGLDPQNAYILGLLHDIGRREGVTAMRHVLDGYYFLNQAGFDDAARICMTHSFPIKDIGMSIGHWDCSPEEYRFAQSYLEQLEYNDYDRLFQLCDALALPSGFCLIEKRLIDVALRYGVGDTTVARWQAVLGLQNDFEAMIGGSIYRLLPGVVETTFGFKEHVA